MNDSQKPILTEENEKNVNNELEDLLTSSLDFPSLDSLGEEQSSSSIAMNESPKLIDSLSKERQRQAYELAAQINTEDTDSILEYGAAAQQKLGEFSHSMLNHVQSQETGTIGVTLNDLMYKLKEANPDDLIAPDRNVFQKLFGKINRSIYEITAKYQKIGAQVDKIAVKLDKEKNDLLKDNHVLEQLYQKNVDYFDALNLYIAAGELKIEELLRTTIPEAVKVAESSTNQMDTQRVNDLNQFLDRLEKRTHDLKLARQMTIQQAPQIRLIQNTNQALSEKIQTSINTAIPLWKNQIVIALTLLRQKQAITAQRQVSETTNELMQKNSKMLKQSTIETAKENERGVIDIETLEQTQTDLVETLQETLAIQQQGRIKRKEAEKQLSQMENSLREQLLLMTTNKSSE